MMMELVHKACKSNCCQGAALQKACSRCFCHLKIVNKDVYTNALRKNYIVHCLSSNYAWCWLFFNKTSRAILPPYAANELLVNRTYSAISFSKKYVASQLPFDKANWCDVELFLFFFSYALSIKKTTNFVTLQFLILVPATLTTYRNSRPFQ